MEKEVIQQFNKFRQLYLNEKRKTIGYHKMFAC